MYSSIAFFSVFQIRDVHSFVSPFWAGVLHQTGKRYMPCTVMYNVSSG